MATLTAPSRVARWHDAPAPCPLALPEAREREADATHAFRLAVARAESTCALAARLLADLDERIAAVCARLRQAGYLGG